jgi:hypothetical protein
MDFIGRNMQKRGVSGESILRNNEPHNPAKEFKTNRIIWMKPPFDFVRVFGVFRGFQISTPFPVKKPKKPTNR